MDSKSKLVELIHEAVKTGNLSPAEVIAAAEEAASISFLALNPINVESIDGGSDLIALHSQIAQNGASYAGIKWSPDSGIKIYDTPSEDSDMSIIARMATKLLNELFSARDRNKRTTVTNLLMGRAVLKFLDKIYHNPFTAVRLGIGRSHSMLMGQPNTTNTIHITLNGDLICYRDDELKTDYQAQLSCLVPQTKSEEDRPPIYQLSILSDSKTLNSNLKCAYVVDPLDIRFAGTDDVKNQGIINTVKFSYLPLAE